MSEPWHGTLNGYNNHRCRCDKCKAANAARMREYRLRRGTSAGTIRGTPTDEVADDVRRAIAAYERWKDSL